MICHMNICKYYKAAIEKDNKIYKFYFTDCKHEYANCISVHRTMEGAEEALNKDKAEWYHEHGSIDYEMCDWYIIDEELLP